MIKCSTFNNSIHTYQGAFALFNRIRAKVAKYFFIGAPTLYHFWYYHHRVWEQTTWMGVPTLKSTSDMWNYQEIIHSLEPSVLVEFGSCRGGSALFFSSIMRQIGRPYLVVSVDINLEPISEKTKSDPNIKLLTMSSTDKEVQAEIAATRRRYPGPAFFILDSDHSESHVLSEMVSLREVTLPGDYLIVEDSNINGHPVLRSFGPGPFEAMQEYFKQYPNDYRRDAAREKKFGFTFATKGFLIRNSTGSR